MASLTGRPLSFPCGGDGWRDCLGAVAAATVECVFSAVAQTGCRLSCLGRWGHSPINREKVGSEVGRKVGRATFIGNCM